MYKKLLLVLLSCMSFHICCADEKEVDFIIFSYNRPLQLYALLESTEKLVTGLRNIYVLYRSGSHDFDMGYQIVKERFPYVFYVKQQKQKDYKDFKPLLLKIFDWASSEYILFGVDDIVVKEYVDLLEVTRIMRKYNVYGCFLRLCPDIDYMYSWQRPQEVPPLHKVDEGYMWQFRDGAHISDWGYPHTVDMTIYKKSEIEHGVKHADYHNPNTFEARWSSNVTGLKKRHAFCYQTTKMVNLPLNLVQTSYTGNPHMTNEEFKPQQLLKLFLDGYKMDITTLFGIKNRSAHIEYIPTFILR